MNSERLAERRREMPIRDGKYKARAVGEVVLGKSAEKQTPQIECLFEMLEGESKGHRARWTGYFGLNSADRTIESLQICGWEGDDLSEFADKGLHGLDANEVEAVIENEEYEKDGEIRTVPRVRWINRLGGGARVNVQNAMSRDEALSFGDRMKGLVLKVKSKQQKADPSLAGDAFPFGANEKATGTGGRKF
jgi:hypothetical protein